LQQLDCAAGEAGERARGMNFDNPVAGVFSTAVDTENSHGLRFSLTRNMWGGLGGVEEFRALPPLANNKFSLTSFPHFSNPHGLPRPSVGVDARVGPRAEPTRVRIDDDTAV